MRSFHCQHRTYILNLNLPPELGALWLLVGLALRVIATWAG